MNMKHRIVTIFLPDGRIKHFTTSKDCQDKEVELVHTIECEPGLVHIALKEDNTVDGYSYVGMPYVLNMF